MRDVDPRAREILERTEALTPEEQLMRLHGAIREWGCGRCAAGRRSSAPRPSGRGRRRRGARGSRVGCARARAATCSTSRWPARSRSSRRSTRTWRAPCTWRSSSRTTRAATSASAPARPPLLLRARRGRAARRPAAPPAARPGRGHRQRLPRRRRLRRRALGAPRWPARGCPPGVEVVDFGIRGMDLAYALGEGYDAAVLLDAVPRGRRPGRCT